MRSKSILVVVMVVYVSSSQVMAEIRYNGGTHDITTTINDSISIYNSFWGQPGTVNLLAGGSIAGAVAVLEYSRLNVIAGLIEGYVYAPEYGQITVLDGTIKGELNAIGASQVAVLGGAIMDSVEVYYDSHALIAGGFIGGAIEAHGGQITVVGRDFRINGQSFDDGLLTNSDYPSGILTGTLASGTPIDNHFEIYGMGKIALVPIPNLTLTVNAEPNDRSSNVFSVNSFLL